ncbi:hypothetical protein, partial [Mycoplasmoides pneumoniae]|uniref:hypothetical protein n=1 Tax=Mycoplasmoides pneumoniae TaxID=2104 RepID=UPI001F287DEE
PGDTCTYEGIYKCTGCGKEVTIAGGKTLPPQNHHQHSPGQGDIRWQLFVYAEWGMKMADRRPLNPHVVVPKPGGGTQPRDRNNNGRVREKRSDAGKSRK